MRRLAALVLLLLPGAALAQAGLPALTLSQAADGGQTWSVSLQVLAVMTFLTLLPGVLLAVRRIGDLPGLTVGLDALL